MFNNSTLFRTSLPLVKTAPKVRGFDKDIRKWCVFDIKTTISYMQLTDEDIMMKWIR